jgi:ABC-type dipeptide/oligopeptide/nickel transport system ATPase component
MQRKIILIIGPSGSGKTRTASELMDELDRVAVFDIVGDEQYALDSKGKPRDGVVVVDGRPREFGRAIGMSFDNELTVEKDKFKVVYHPKNVETMDNGLADCPEFGMIVRACHQRGHMYLVIDEAHMLCNSYNCPPELMKANLVGRHQEFSMILIAHRFNGIAPAIRENADEIYFWKVITGTSKKAIAEYCGDDVAEQVAGLRAVELDDNDKFKRAGQRLHWTKFRGVVEVTE